MQNANSLATASSYAHLAEPGCLCQAGTVSRASKAPGAGLGTRRSTLHTLTMSCVLQ